MKQNKLIMEENFGKKYINEVIQIDYYRNGRKQKVNLFNELNNSPNILISDFEFRPFRKILNAIIET